MSAIGFWSQFNTNRNLSFGCSEEEILFTAKRLDCDTAQLGKQQGCRAALGPGPPLPGQFCSAPPWPGLFCVTPVCFVPHWFASLCSGEAFSVFLCSLRKTVSCGKGKCTPWAPGRWGSWPMGVLPLVTNWSILMQMRTPNPCSLIFPKGTVLIGQNRATLIGWSCAALIGWGEPQFYWLKWVVQIAEMQCRQAVHHKGRQSSASLSLKCSLSDRPLGRNGC